MHICRCVSYNHIKKKKIKSLKNQQLLLVIHSLTGVLLLCRQYKFHDVAIEELQKIYRIFPGMVPSTGTYS